MNKKQDKTTCCVIIPLMLMISFCCNCMNANAWETGTEKDTLVVEDNNESLVVDAGVDLDSGPLQDAGFHSDAGASSALFSEDAISLESGSEQKRLYEIYADDVTTKSIRAARINRKALAEDSIDLNLFPSKNATARKQNIKIRMPGDFSWFGRFDGADGKAIFTVTGEYVRGIIERNNRMFRVRPLGGGLSAIIEVDKTKFGPKCAMGLDKEKSLKEENTDNPTTAQNNPDNNDQEKDGYKTSKTLPIYIGVQFAFTTAATGELANMYNEAQAAVDDLNNALSNSAVNAEYYLTAAFEVSYEESDEEDCWDYLDEDLTAFKNGTDGCGTAHTYRSRYDADVNIMMVDQQDNDPYSGPQCGGLAGINGCPNGDEDAFVVVDTDYIDFEVTPGHEIAHLHGCRHHDECVPLMEDPEGHGYLFTSPPPYYVQYMTIMVVEEDGYYHCDYFSNPDVSYHGSATGSNSSELCGEGHAHNCASVLNDTAADLAGFETIPTNLTLSSETVYDKEFRLAQASTSIATTSGQSYTIKSGAMVYFDAPTITLKKGFKAESGSHFFAPAVPEE